MIRLILEEGWMERKDMNEQFLIDDAYWNGIAPREKLINMIAANYANPNESASYQAGTDMVILSAKYGKTKLPMAKILAGVLFGVAAFTIHVAVAFGITIAAFGIDGWNLPLQINGTAVPYPFTFFTRNFSEFVCDLSGINCNDQFDIVSFSKWNFRNL